MSANLVSPATAAWIHREMRAGGGRPPRMARPPRDLDSSPPQGLRVGPPPTTQIHPHTRVSELDADYEPVAEALLSSGMRVINAGSEELPDYRICLDISRLYVGDFTDEEAPVVRPIADFLAPITHGATPSTEIALKLDHVAGKTLDTTPADAVAAVPLRLHSGTEGSRLYPRGAEPYVSGS